MIQCCAGERRQQWKGELLHSFFTSVRENANELRHLPNNSRTDMQHRRMYFMNITIQDLQSYLSHRYSGWATEQSMFMKLVEEIGEVAEVLNKRAGRKFSSEEDLQTQLGTELADMLHYIVAIAAINDIDLTQVILEKDKLASVKYHHDVNLETFLTKTTD